MSETPALGSGVVEISLGGETYQMRATLDAALLISRMHGGLVGTQNRVLSLDFDTIVAVVQNGMGLTQAGLKKMELPQKIFAEGLDTVAAVAVKFLVLLANGGRESALEGRNDSVDPMNRTAASA